MIGTSIFMNTSQEFTYPSISVCEWTFNDPAIIVDGEWFESYESYEKTNVTTPYVSSRIPHLADTNLHYMLSKDANGTQHVLYPAGNQTQHLMKLAKYSAVTVLNSTR